MLQGRRGARRSVDAPSSTYTPNCAKFSDFFVRSSMTFTLQPRPSKRLTPCRQPRIPCPAGQHPASPRENLGVRCGRGKTAKPGSGARCRPTPQTLTLQEWNTVCAVPVRCSVAIPKPDGTLIVRKASLTWSKFGKKLPSVRPSDSVALP